MDALKKIIALVALFTTVVVWAADVVYVRSHSAKLMADKSLKSQQIATAGKGTELKVLAKDKGWYQVEYKGKKAWVSALLVAKSKPSGTVSVLNDENDTLQNDSRRRASSVTTAGAIRGLQENELSQNQGDKADFKALKEVEKQKVNKDEARQFMEEVTK